MGVRCLRLQSEMVTAKSHRSGEGRAAHLLGMERPVLAREPLANDPCSLVNENRRVVLGLHNVRRLVAKQVGPVAGGTSTSEIALAADVDCKM